jgi:hypothetical protein
MTEETLVLISKALELMDSGDIREAWTVIAQVDKLGEERMATSLARMCVARMQTWERLRK